MTALDLAPAASAASRPRRILAHARIEAGLTLRNGEQLLLALVIPIGLLVAGSVYGDRPGWPYQTFAASVLALALWSTGFTSLAITTGFERRYGVLERLVATPLRRSDLLLGKAVSVTAIAAGQGSILALAAWLLGWRPLPTPTQTLIVLLAGPLAILAFAGLALALAGTAKADVTLALANLIYLAGAVAGGLMLPVASFPAGVQPWVSALPTAALGESLRTWASGGTAPLPLAILGCWVAVGLILARKVFRWTS